MEFFLVRIFHHRQKIRVFEPGNPAGLRKSFSSQISVSKFGVFFEELNAKFVTKERIKKFFIYWLKRLKLSIQTQNALTSFTLKQFLKKLFKHDFDHTRGPAGLSLRAKSMN